MKCIKSRGEPCEAFNSRILYAVLIRRIRRINERLLSLGYDEDDISEDIDESYWKWSALVDQPIGLNDESE